MVGGDEVLMGLRKELSPGISLIDFARTFICGDMPEDG